MSERDFEISVDESFFGDVEKFIKKVKRNEMLCVCGNRVIAEDFLGYVHEGGLTDFNGTKWWIYVRCPKCNYDISFTKIENSIEKLKIEDEFNE